MAGEESGEDYDTGPFCRHWRDPGDCEDKCAACGHRCADHRFGDGETSCYVCECEEWKDAKGGAAP